MKKFKIGAIITGFSMILVGLVIAGIALAKTDFSLEKISTVEMVENTYMIEEDFTKLNVECGVANVQVHPSEDRSVRVDCIETDKLYHEVSVENDTLVIRQIDQTDWSDNIGIYTKPVEVNVYLPKAEYIKAKVQTTSGTVNFTVDINGELEIQNSSGSTYVGEISVDSLNVNNSSGGISISSVQTPGDIVLKASSGSLKLDGIKCENMTLETTSGSIRLGEVEALADINIVASSGEIDLENLTCENLNAENTSGSANCRDVITTGKICIENSSGGIRLERCDAAELKLKASSGSIKGTLLTEKIFVADASSGSVDVPKTTSGGVCEVTTSSGSISLEIISK